MHMERRGPQDRPARRATTARTEAGRKRAEPRSAAPEGAAERHLTAEVAAEAAAGAVEAAPRGRTGQVAAGAADPPGRHRRSASSTTRAPTSTGWRRWLPSWRLVTGLFVGFCASLMAAAGIGYAMVDVPKTADTAKAQNNVYYWANGKQMVATGGETNRQIVKYEEIPEAMQNAVISAENKTFETDKGVDPMGIARAVRQHGQGRRRRRAARPSPSST